MGSFLSKSYSHLLAIIANVSFSLSFMKFVIGVCAVAEGAALESMAENPSCRPRRVMRRSMVMPYIPSGWYDENKPDLANIIVNSPESAIASARIRSPPA